MKSKPTVARSGGTTASETPTIAEVLQVIHSAEVDLEGIFGGLRTLMPPVSPKVVSGRLEHHERIRVAADLLVSSLLDVRMSLGVLSERLRYSDATIRKGKAVA
jgi:hypothetical protein